MFETLMNISNKTVTETTTYYFEQGKKCRKKKLQKQEYICESQ